MAGILGVNKSTVSREINSGKRKSGCYEATAAQLKANVKRVNSKYQGMKIEAHPELRARVIAELARHRSPDEIAGRMKRERLTPRVNTNAIYKWLYSVHGQPYCRYLCTRRYRKRPHKEDVPKREMIPNRISIQKRPRGTGLHHWEWDAMVSPKKANTTASIAVACSITEKYMSGIKLDNLSPEHTVQAVKRVSAVLRVDSVTLDNGIENRRHEDFGVSAYFCNPHSPWQKPRVEGSIGLLRRWFIPKKTNLEQVTAEELQHYITILNNKYRKSLNYQSAYEVALARGIIKN
jgi:IS30 family transposase